MIILTVHHYNDLGGYIINSEMNRKTNESTHCPPLQ